MPILTQGADEAERIAEEIKQSRGGFRMPTFGIKSGDAPVVLRFWTEHTAIITIGTHFFPTKDKPEKWPGDKWPKAMWAVCQNDRAFRLRDGNGNPTDEFEADYGNCYHAAYAGQKDRFGGDMSSPAEQVYGLAVQRKPRIDPQTGSVTGFEDETIELKLEGGKVALIPKFLIVSQKYSNFWHPVKAAAYVGGSIRDKDFLVSRKDNDYNVTVAMTTPDLHPGTTGWAKYDDAMKLMKFDLGEYLIAHSTPDHYKRFFIPGQEPEGGYGRRGSDGDEGEQQETAVADTAVSRPDVSEDAMAAFANQLKGRGKPAADAQQQ